MATDINEFFGDLEGGLLADKLSAILSEVAGAVMDHSRKGNVTIKLDFSRLGKSGQVMVGSDLQFTRPTEHGKKSEQTKLETSMYVGQKGKLTFFPEDQSQLFTKTGEVVK